MVLVYRFKQNRGSGWLLLRSCAELEYLQRGVTMVMHGIFLLATGVFWG